MIKCTHNVTATSDVAQMIREDIVAGALIVGQRVTIDALAIRYSVSHMPVCEALRELQGEGLVTIEPNRGARVRTVDANFIDNLFEIRVAPEVMLIRRAAQRCEPSDIDALRMIEADLEQAIAMADYTAAAGHNQSFHRAINRIADNVDAQPIIDRHWTLLAAFWRHFGYGESRFAGVANDHQHLIATLAAHDVDAAALIMGAHSNKVKLVLKDRVATQKGVAMAQPKTA